MSGTAMGTTLSRSHWSYTIQVRAYFFITKFVGRLMRQSERLRSDTFQTMTPLSMAVICGLKSRQWGLNDWIGSNLALCGETITVQRLLPRSMLLWTSNPDCWSDNYTKFFDYASFKFPNNYFSLAEMTTTFLIDWCHVWYLGAFLVFTVWYEIYVNGMRCVIAVHILVFFLLESTLLR